MNGGNEGRCIVPIAEFFEIKYGDSTRGAGYEIINADSSKYAEGVKQALQSSYGIYIFYDSRGRALYAGKAQEQSLWKEMNSAYNRDRGDLQQIRLVYHPPSAPYKSYD